jgi:hypothetical protein
MSSKRDSHISKKRNKHDGMRRRHHDGKRRHRVSARGGGSMKIPRFLRRNQMARSTLYGLWQQGLGPRAMRFGRNVRISFESERDWIKQMEIPAAAPVPALADIALDDLEDSDTLGRSAEQDDETDAGDEIRVKRRRQKHRHVHSERRDLVLRLDALKPEHSELSDEGVARKHGTKQKRTRKRGHGKKSRSHRDE